VIFSATLALWAMFTIVNYVDRHNFEGWKPNDWIGAELYTLPLRICAVLAGWGKTRWLQWVGVAGMLAQNLGFFVFYTLGT
jgi:hypothetical protein